MNKHTPRPKIMPAVALAASILILSPLPASQATLIMDAAGTVDEIAGSAKFEVTGAVREQLRQQFCTPNVLSMGEGELTCDVSGDPGGFVDKSALIFTRMLGADDLRPTAGNMLFQTLLKGNFYGVDSIQGNFVVNAIDEMEPCLNELGISSSCDHMAPIHCDVLAYKEEDYWTPYFFSGFQGTSSDDDGWDDYYQNCPQGRISLITYSLMVILISLANGDSPTAVAAFDKVVTQTVEVGNLNLIVAKALTGELEEEIDAVARGIGFAGTGAPGADAPATVLIPTMVTQVWDIVVRLSGQGEAESQAPAGRTWVAPPGGDLDENEPQNCDLQMWGYYDPNAEETEPRDPWKYDHASVFGASYEIHHGSCSPLYGEYHHFYVQTQLHADTGYWSMPWGSTWGYIRGYMASVATGPGETQESVPCPEIKGQGPRIGCDYIVRDPSLIMLDQGYGWDIIPDPDQEPLVTKLVRESCCSNPPADDVRVLARAVCAMLGLAGLPRAGASDADTTEARPAALPLLAIAVGYRLAAIACAAWAVAEVAQEIHQRWTHGHEVEERVASEGSVFVADMPMKIRPSGDPADNPHCHWVKSFEFRCWMLGLFQAELETTWPSDDKKTYSFHAIQTHWFPVTVYRHPGWDY